MRLANKVAVITGAARGQGEAVARRYAREGARLIISDRDEAGVSSVAEDIRRSGGEALFVTADVRSGHQVAAIIEMTRNEYGALHVLYNNAGIYEANADAPSADLPESVFDRNIAVNLKGVYLCCHHAIPLLLESGGGVILNVGSVASYAGDPLAHAYAASKGGLLAYTRSIATHYGKLGLRANVICPGFIDTPMVAPLLSDPATMDSIIQHTMLRRIGTVEDVANLATFLASNEASFLTGAVFPVDGGLIK